MARDQRSHVYREEAPATAPSPVNAASNPPLAADETQPDHRAHMLALIRALARDAARADHEQDITTKSDD
jgi:hypothetical protein